MAIRIPHVNHRIALDLIAGEALQHARKHGTDRFGNGLSLAGLLGLMPDHNPEMVEQAFFALCLSGEWPGSRGRKQTRFA